MSQRAGWLVVALLGVLLVAGLALLGRDISHLARTGPKWRRRLLAAGLALLSTLGVPACDNAPDRPAAVAPTPPAPRDLVETPQWKRLAATWREAEQVVSGERGRVPFDDSDKTRLRAELKAAQQDTAELEKAGWLSREEGYFVRLALEAVDERVGHQRTERFTHSTCYAPSTIPAARGSMERLAQRLPFLERLVASGKLRASVARKVLITIEDDFATLSEEHQIARLLNGEQLEARGVAAAIAVLVPELKAAANERDPTRDLEEAADWKLLEGAWLAAITRPVVIYGHERRLKSAMDSIQRLNDGGLLMGPEAEFLKTEAEWIVDDLANSQPRQQFTCYSMAYQLPAKRSIERLRRRLPLLDKLIASGKVHRAAVEKILAAVVVDIMVSSDPLLPSEEGWADFPREFPLGMPRSEEVQKDLEPRLARIRALLANTAD